MKTKIHKTYNLIIRIIILLVTFGFIYKQIFYKHDFEQIFSSFHEYLTHPDIFFSLGLVIFLMLINWGIETLKWKFLIKKIEKIRYFKAYLAVLTGVAVSSFTPNRIGDYLGRVFILEKANRIEGVLITIIGSLSQFLVTIIIGTISLAIFIFNFRYELIEYLEMSNRLFYFLYLGSTLLVIILFILLILLFLNVSIVTDLANRIVKPKWKKIKDYLRIFSFYTRRELIIVLLYSLIRFFVFSLQFYILLRVFMVPIPYLPGLIVISIIFFVMTMIPSVAITELGIRGSVTLYIFGLFFAQSGIENLSIEIGTVAASSTLWLINLAIPSLIGAIFVFNLKFFRKNV